MKKSELIPIFIRHLEEELQLIIAAAKATHEAATHEESRPENEYDTRGLEAAYLAGAQAKRVREINEVLTLFKTLPFADFGPGETVHVTTLVTIELDGKKSRILMMPKGGGIHLKVDEEVIQIVTPQSTLGESITGYKAGETAEFEVGPKVRFCKILSVS
jgi:hypothetical protein